MTETIQNNGLWHITLVEDDLVNQAKLKREDFEQDFGFFRYKKRAVVISHCFGEHLVASMEGKDDEVLKEFVDGLTKVVGYKPFCKYNLSTEVSSGTKILPTYEWDKINPKARYKELSNQASISGLAKLCAF
jgi:hypothetical protein